MCQSTNVSMSKGRYYLLALLAVVMGLVAWGVGNWAVQVSPDGIAEHPGLESEPTATPRNSFYFGVSTGLLAMGLLYCCLAIGLLIHAKVKGRGVGAFVYSVVGLAVLGFALSYLVDDYFY